MGRFLLFEAQNLVPQIASAVLITQGRLTDWQIEDLGNNYDCESLPRNVQEYLQTVRQGTLRVRRGRPRRVSPEIMARDMKILAEYLLLKIEHDRKQKRHEMTDGQRHWNTPREHILEEIRNKYNLNLSIERLANIVSATKKNKALCNGAIRDLRQRAPDLWA